MASVDFRLVSTRATQNPLLHSLLKWRAAKNITEALHRFTYIEMNERIKVRLRVHTSLDDSEEGGGFVLLVWKGVAH